MPPAPTPGRQAGRADAVRVRCLAGGRRLAGAANLAGLPVLLLEAFDAAGGIDELLLARVERVAGGADVDGERAAGGVGLDRVPACAGDGRGLVDGVDAFFRHDGVPENGLL